MTEDEEVRRGHEAKRLLETPLLIEAFKTIELEILTKWHESPAGDEKGREKLWLSIKLLNRVEAHVKSVALTGEMAQLSLKQKASALVGRSALPI